MENRLRLLIENSGLTSVKFAELLGVQPSSISHILSGRNKPSYDFIEKLLSKFPDVDPRWLITGIHSPPANIFDESLPFKNPELKSKPKQVEKIMVIYTDKTFEEYFKDN